MVQLEPPKVGSEDGSVDLSIRPSNLPHMFCRVSKKRNYRADSSAEGSDALRIAHESAGRVVAAMRGLEPNDVEHQ